MVFTGLFYSTMVILTHMSLIAWNKDRKSSEYHIDIDTHTHIYILLLLIAIGFMRIFLAIDTSMFKEVNCEPRI